MSKKKKKTTVIARPRVNLSPGEMVRIARELQEMTQGQLSQGSGIDEDTIARIEREDMALDVERAEKLGRALKTHPNVLLRPNWVPEDNS